MLQGLGRGLSSIIFVMVFRKGGLCARRLLKFKKGRMGVKTIRPFFIYAVLIKASDFFYNFYVRWELYVFRLIQNVIVNVF